MEVQVRREDCAALNQQSFGSNAIQFPDMRNIMHIPGPEPSGSGTAGGNIAERNYPTFSCSGVPEPSNQKLQLIDSI